MENDNVRTMELLGEDFWSNEVYKCIETGILYKNMAEEGTAPELCSCGNDFEGEPAFPINSNFEIHFKETVKQVSKDQKFNYMLLGRLKSDCDYYLGYGCRQASKLWAGNEKEQISKMKELHDSFPPNEKPEWLTYKQICTYEKQLMSDSCV